MGTASLRDIIDLVNDRDEVVGSARRRDLGQVSGGHRVSHVFIFNAAGELLLGQLGAVRTQDPGAWGSSVAAQVLKGESYEHAAHRRLVEELGADTPLVGLFKTALTDFDPHKFVYLFEGHMSDVELCEPDHVSALTFRSLDDIRADVARNPETYTPTFRSLLEHYTSR